MHIGIDGRLPYYRMGGISQYILHLLPALAALDRQNQYTVFHSRKDNRSYQPPATANFRRRDLWTPCHHRWERWALGAELLRHQLDVFHSPDFIPPQWGGRRIITVHDLNFIHFPQFLTADSRRYYAGHIQWAIRAADHIAADSHATRRDLVERLHAPPAKVTTIHLAANPIYQRYNPADTVDQTLARYNLPRGFILFVGTLEPRKNVPTLIRAYHHLRQEAAVDVPLLLVGARGWRDDDIFATIEALALRQHVRHLSGVPDEHLAHLYSAAGILAAPSYYEGFGLPALEAMHCGCPVVASNRGSLPEILGPAGVLLDDPDDVPAWAHAIGRVLTDTNLRVQMIARGYAQARQFSWPKTAAATLELYRQT